MRAAPRVSGDFEMAPADQLGAADEITFATLARAGDGVADSDDGRARVLPGEGA